MAYKRKDIMEIKQMVQLYSKGYSNRRIASELTINRNTVNRYIKMFKSCEHGISDLLDMDEGQLAELISPCEEMTESDRLKSLRAFFPEVAKQTKATGFTYQELWRQYRDEQPDGYGYTQFMEHYHRWNAKNEPTLKLHHPPGQRLMMDYTGEKLHWVELSTGEIMEVEVFVAAMAHSGYVFAEASNTQRKEDFIGSTKACLNYLGGVPEVLVPDNLKSAVSKASKYEPIANRTFRDMALYYGAVLNPTRPHTPRDKALVERMVSLVYQQVFFKMRGEVYHSLHALNERIRELIDQLNDRKLSQLGCSRRELFMANEYAKLKPLPPQPFEMKTHQRAKVQKSSHVYMSADKHYYSVPYRYIGKHVRIQYTMQVVEVYYKHQRIASHPRKMVLGGYSTKREHLASHHQEYLGWSPSYFMSRAAVIVPNTHAYVQRMFSQPGFIETKYKSAMGIIHLEKQYSRDRIERACQLAVLHPSSSYHRVHNILRKKVDTYTELFEDQTEPPPIPKHENIRGSEYYN